MKSSQTNTSSIKRKLWLLWSKCIPVVHILMNISIVLFLSFHHQSRLYQILYDGKFSTITEGIAYYSFFAASIICFVISWLINPGYLTEKQAKKFEEAVRYKSKPRALAPLSDNEEQEVDTTYAGFDTCDNAGHVNFLNPNEEYMFSDGIMDDDNEDDDDYHSLQNPGESQSDLPFSDPNEDDDDYITINGDVEGSALLSGSTHSTLTGANRIKSTLVAADTTTNTAVNSTRSNSKPQPTVGGKKWARLTNDEEFLKPTSLQEILPSSTVQEPDAAMTDQDLDSIHSDQVIKHSCFGRRKQQRNPIFPFGKQIMYCTVCKLSKPLRCKHCDICNRCIIKYDHHCPWMNNCIGERNHRYFFIFLLLQCILIWWSFRYILHSFKAGGDWLMWTRNNGLFMVCFLTMICGGVPVTGLLIYHLYVLTSGITTWELISRNNISYLRDLPQNMNPFDKGCFRNCLFSLCRPFPINWNQMYSDATFEWRRKRIRLMIKQNKKRAKKRRMQKPPAKDRPLTPVTTKQPSDIDKAWVTTEDLKSHRNQSNAGFAALKSNQLMQIGQ